MELSLIIAVVVVVGVIFMLIRSGRKQSRHLDDLHINKSED